MPLLEQQREWRWDGSLIRSTIDDGSSFFVPLWEHSVLDLCGFGKVHLPSLRPTVCCYPLAMRSSPRLLPTPEPIWTRRQDRAELILSFLRTIFTVAWVVFPPVAGWLAVQTSSFSVFAFASGTHIAFTLLFGLLWTQPSARIGQASKKVEATDADTLPKAYISNPYKIGISGIILGSVALQLNITALPLVIMQDLGGTLEQVGINASVAAAVEVPCMIAWGYLALRLSKETILAASSAIFALYLGLMSIAETVLQVLFLQGIAALAIAALLSINISYLQEAIKGRLGLSTSLVDVSRVLSTLGASVVFALHQGEYYASLMEVAAIIALGGTCLMLLARRLAGEDKR